MPNEETYGLTPKGFLAASIISGITDPDKLWDSLAEFVKKEAAEAGSPDGFPVLIFDENGGACATAVRQ